MKKLILLIPMVLFFTNNIFPKDCKPVDEKNVTVKMAYKFSVKGHINSMRLTIVAPHDIKDRQTVNEINFSVEPDSSYKNGNNTYAVFKLYDIDGNFTITMTAKMTIYRMIPEVNQNSDSNFANYLLAEPYIEKDKPEIKDLAATLKKKTDIETTISTFTYVQEHITYQRNAAIGADAVLKSGLGKCMDFSDLLNALLRANDIPAKSVYGMTLHEDGDPGLHAWSEVYLKKQGWILFDPTTGHSTVYRDGPNYKMRIGNKYMVLFEGRNTILGYRYNWRGEEGASVKVKNNYTMYLD